MSVERLYTPAFFALFAANACTVASYAAFFLFPLFISARGGSESDIGIIMGMFSFGAVFYRHRVAELVDALGRKRCFTLGTLGMTLLPLCYLLLHGPLRGFYPLLLGLRLLHGMTLGLCFTAIFTFVADQVPLHRLSEGIGIFGISGLIGLSLGPFLAEGALAHWSFPGLFLLASGIGGLGLALHQPVADSWRRTAAAEPLPGFFQLLRQSRRRRIALLAFLFGFGLAGYSYFVAPLAEARRLPFISLYYIAYTVGAVGVRLVGGRLTDRLGELRILPWALLLGGVGLGGLALVHSEWQLLVTGLLAGSGHGLIFPALNSLAVRGEPAEIRGRLTGIFTGGMDTGMFIGAFALGWVGDGTSLTVLFLVAGGALLAGLPLLRGLARPSS